MTDIPPFGYPIPGGVGAVIVKGDKGDKGDPGPSSAVVITDNGDGTFTITGSDVVDNGDGTFTINN